MAKDYETRHPDTYYGDSRGGNYTIVASPADGIFYAMPFPREHGEMLSFRMRASDRAKMAPDPQGQDVGTRRGFQRVGKGYLARVRAIGKRASLLIWPTSFPELHTNSSLKALAGQTAAWLVANGHPGLAAMEVVAPTQKYDDDDKARYNFPQRTLFYSVDRSGQVRESDEAHYRSKAGAREADIAPPSPKTYEINGGKYTIADLERMRKEIHLRGSGHVDPVLCAIDDTLHPELKGYRPLNCPGPAPMKAGGWTSPRSPEDWRGSPYWRLRSEGIPNFSAWLEARERNTKSMTAKELLAHAELGDHGLRMYAKAGGDDGKLLAMKYREAKRDGLLRDILKNGIKDPVEVRVGPKGRKTLVKGHHRLAIALRHFPDRQIRIRYVHDEPISESDLSYLLNQDIPAYTGPEKHFQPKDGVSRHVSATGSTRFIQHADGRPVAAIQVMRNGDDAVVANVYTAPEFRRQGLATKLFNHAKRHFPNLRHSAHLTGEGEKFKGSLEE